MNDNCLASIWNNHPNRYSIPLHSLKIFTQWTVLV